MNKDCVVIAGAAKNELASPLFDCDVGGLEGRCVVAGQCGPRKAWIGGAYLPQFEFQDQRFENGVFEGGLGRCLATFRGRRDGRAVALSPPERRDQASRRRLPNWFSLRR
jgi:hypothetical protein